MTKVKGMLTSDDVQHSDHHHTRGWHSEDVVEQIHEGQTGSSVYKEEEKHVSKTTTASVGLGLECSEHDHDEKDGNEVVDHVPREAGRPIGPVADPRHLLQMLGTAGPLLYQEYDETGR